MQVKEAVAEFKRFQESTESVLIQNLSRAQRRLPQELEFGNLQNSALRRNPGDLQPGMGQKQVQGDNR